MEKNMYDLVTIFFGDIETQARPFEFTKDDDDNFIEPCKAITTCPKCGHGQEVFINGSDSVFFATCDNCNLGYEEVEYEDIEDEDTEDEENRVENTNSIEIQEIKEKLSRNLYKEKCINSISSNIKVEKSDDIEVLTSGCTFVDPISLGTFNLEDL